MSKLRVITTKMVDQWVELYQAGYSCWRISKMCKLNSSSVVWRHLNSRNIDTSNSKPRRFDNPDYVICIYDNDDTLVYQFDSVDQMSKKLNIKKITIFCNFSHERKFININNKRYKIEKVRF